MVPYGGLFPPISRKIKERRLPEAAATIKGAEISREHGILEGNDLERNTKSHQTAPLSHAPPPTLPPVVAQETGSNYSTASEGEAAPKVLDSLEEASIPMTLDANSTLPIVDVAATSKSVDLQFDAAEWKNSLKRLVAAGNRKAAQEKVRSLLAEYFIIDKTGELIFLDDNTTRLRGADIKKIVNYMVPMKNINPKIKPTGFSVVLDILRSRSLNDPELFPNNEVGNVISSLGGKASAHAKKIEDIDKLNVTIREIANGLAASSEPFESSTARGKNWSTFT